MPTTPTPALSAERLAEIAALLERRKAHKPVWPHFFGPPALEDSHLSDLLAELARRPTPEAVAEQLRGLLKQADGWGFGPDGYSTRIFNKGLADNIKDAAATLCPGISLD